MKCKWEQDDFCVNADCPYVADFCPCSEFQEICKYCETDDIALNNLHSVFMNDSEN